jgi:hypothetical protein
LFQRTIRLRWSIIKVARGEQSKAVPKKELVSEPAPSGGLRISSKRLVVMNLPLACSPPDFLC